MRFLPFIAAVLLPVGFASAQAPSDVPRNPTISVETSLVVLPITVVDQRGAVVGGLTAERFKVYDNGELQTVEFFAPNDSPATVGLVIDCSSSMSIWRQQLTAAATAFAEISHPRDELYTMNFNETVWPGFVQPFVSAQDIEELRTALALAPAAGMTALYDALNRALEHAQHGTHERRFLIVVSDGGDNASTHSLHEVTNYAARTGTVVYSVILADRDDHDARPGVLKALARATGGQSFAPTADQTMTAIFARIAEEIRGGYTVGFAPRETSNERFRTIRITVHDPEKRRLIARTRRGYYASTAR